MLVPLTAISLMTHHRSRWKRKTLFGFLLSRNDNWGLDVLFTCCLFVVWFFWGGDTLLFRFIVSTDKPQIKDINLSLESLSKVGHWKWTHFSSSDKWQTCSHHFHINLSRLSLATFSNFLDFCFASCQSGAWIWHHNKSKLSPKCR